MAKQSSTDTARRLIALLGHFQNEADAVVCHELAHLKRNSVPGFEIEQWWGIAAPAKTPAAVVKKLHTEIVKVLQSPDVRELLAKQGATAHAESPTQFTAFIKAERSRIARVGRQVGITLD